MNTKTELKNTMMQTMTAVALLLPEASAEYGIAGHMGMVPDTQEWMMSKVNAIAAIPAEEIGEYSTEWMTYCMNVIAQKQSTQSMSDDMFVLDDASTVTCAQREEYNLVARMVLCDDWDERLDMLTRYEEDDPIALRMTDALSKHVGCKVLYTSHPAFVRYNGEQVEGWRYRLYVDDLVVAQREEC